MSALYLLGACISTGTSVYCTLRVIEEPEFMYSGKWWFLMCMALGIALTMLLRLF